MGDRSDDIMDAGIVIVFLVVVYWWANRTPAY